MAKFELPIYGENDELVKTYTTDHIRWNARILKITEVQDENGYAISAEFGF